MPDALTYQSRKNDFIANTVLAGCILITSTYYQTSYRNIDRLKNLKRGFVLLPNHQSTVDIALEGVLLQRALGKKAYYVMKDELSDFFEYCGGIKIIRRKDLGKNNSRDEKVRELEIAKQRRDYVMDALYQLLSKEEIVVMHTQGNRAYKKPFEANRPNLKKLLIIQKRIGKTIPFVPLTISYEDVKTLFSRIVVNVGNPIQVPDDGLEILAEHLMKEICLEL